jgi:DNA-binding CsgD family transcriptional regulator
MTAPRRRSSARKTQTSDAATAERDNTVWQLRLQGFTLRQIGARLGLSHETIRLILERGRAELIYPKIEEQRATELERLDEMLHRAWSIMDREHALVSHGRLIADENGLPLPDTGPILAAMDRVLRISERRAKLLGLDAATKVEAQVFAPETDEVRALAEEAARRLADDPCPTCTGPLRETVGMICQTCGTDYSRP